jgi:uncharacterized protein (UPF0264 family)
MMPRIPGLLVSVRSVAEAAAALAGGADLIDVKEPSRGPLGRADGETIAAVIRHVNKWRPVSAALGELVDNESLPSVDGLDFVKWGLAGCFRRIDWRARLASGLMNDGSPRAVIVAYADWERVEAPPLDDVAEFARPWPGATFLLDTFGKDPAVQGSARPSLLSWLSSATVTQLCRSLHDAGVRVAIAGSLDAEDIKALRCAEPDWFAVRGAVCVQGRRDGAICASRVRELVNLLHQAPGNPAPERPTSVQSCP